VIAVGVRPLGADAYAPYGEVLAAHRRGEPGKPANQGTARRFDRLVDVANLRPASATLNVAVFRCTPTASLPIELALLERHASSTQVFVPMTARRYLVVVARGGDAPDLATLAAFEARGDQGVSYHPGVWHHPMIALEAETDFACLVYEDDSAGDCHVVRFAPGERPVVTAR
jgi:ureidoglycolate lyase